MAIARLYNRKVRPRLVNDNDLVLRKAVVNDPKHSHDMLALRWEGPYVSDCRRPTASVRDKTFSSSWARTSRASCSLARMVLTSCLRSLRYCSKVLSSAFYRSTSDYSSLARCSAVATTSGPYPDFNSLFVSQSIVFQSRIRRII
ncbi:hypothetical protein BHE74_00046682 [Ensete ventricosum]|nr:hypothetical protein BHE74_00046682 [Ensete ventricosum]